MLRGVKFRAYPTKEQAEILSRWIGCARLIYNDKVEKDRAARNQGLLAPPDQSYASAKTDDRPYLSEVPSQLLRNSAVRWRQSYERFFKGLGGRPTFKKRGPRDSVWLTDELFSFEGGKLLIGTKKFPVGELEFYAHRPFETPKTITIRRKNYQWWVSFCYETEEVIRTPEEILAELRLLPEEVLREVSEGEDRGVVIPVQSSNGKAYTLSPIQQKRLRVQEKKIKRHQRGLARKGHPRLTKKPPSKRYLREQKRLGRCHQYGQNVREDFAHQTSHELAESESRLFVKENLKIKSMVARPKAKKDASGKWTKNGRAAKSGLARAILGSAWGRTMLYLSYKAQERNKILIGVEPHYSSQECSECHYIHPDNRQTQSLFVCQKCGYQIHADYNASVNLRERGIALVLSGKVVIKKPKKAAIPKKKVSSRAGTAPIYAQGDLISQGMLTGLLAGSSICETPTDRVSDSGG